MAVMIYGASGGLGKMVAGAVREHGLGVVLAGRDAARLQGVARPEDRQHTVDQPWPEGVSVVINCAPLSDQAQTELVQQCLAHNAHLIDASGDQARIFDLLERWDEPAREADLCILPALGFDYAVGDCLALMAGSSEPEWDQVVVAYAMGEAASEATLEFATQGQPRGPERVYRNGDWQSLPLELDRGRFDFPEPVGQRQVGRYGSGEVATVPRHTRTRTVRTVITASSLVPHPLLLPVFPLLRPIVGWILKTPLRRLVGWLGALLGRLRSKPEPVQQTTPQGPPKGPSFMVVAEARRGARRVSCFATGPDCYDTTAHCLALAALWLTEGKALQKGAISAAMAFSPDQFLEHLPGVDWQFMHSPTFLVPEGPPAR